MRHIGKLLQCIGLIALPFCVILELAGNLGRHLGISDMVWMALFGIIAFYLGRLVEGYSVSRQ